MMEEWRNGAGATVALVAVTTALMVVGWQFLAHYTRTCKRGKRSKAQRRELQRAVRRKQKDMQLQRKKCERATQREMQELQMTDEQKREWMECIKMQRVEQYQKMDDGVQHGLRVVVDLAFAHDQTDRERHSIFKQLGCVYGYMKKCRLDRVISLRVASYSSAVAALGSHHGLAKWKIQLHTELLHSVYTSDEVIYLSPDADDVLCNLDPSAVYVVGGIVDRSVRKGQTLGRASKRGHRVVRLPLQEYMIVRKPVLNIDSVVIALNEVANHGDWARAFEVAIPPRMAKRKI